MAASAAVPHYVAGDMQSPSGLQHHTTQFLREDVPLGSVTDHGPVLGQNPHAASAETGYAQHSNQVPYTANSTSPPESSQRPGAIISRSSSAASLTGGNTLGKKDSVGRRSSRKRSNSQKSAQAGEMSRTEPPVDRSSIFYMPIPTSGNPTDVLATRFQNWRKLLKDLINYFKEVQNTHDQRARSYGKLANTANGIDMPAGFLQKGGLGDAFSILKGHHRRVLTEAQKTRELQSDVISQLSGLRSDLGQKIKEIKSLSSDFKNNLEKEKEGTKKILGIYHSSLTAAEGDEKAMIGKDDPYIVRMAVERQVEKQIHEENYLHRAYLNLENSGRELEAIVVGEIQKAINAFSAMLFKESQDGDTTAERLRNGPLSMPRDLEWSEFIEKDPNFIAPDVPMRKADHIEYPGKYHAAAAEVRAGMLERKSKYLKSYTPGWFILSPTHLHEFKSSEGVYTQAPVVSLYLADQSLGSHSQPNSSSHKFNLKGKQSGSNRVGVSHRGHSWVFRAESYDTMLAWYEDIKNLTEKTGQEKFAFVQGHARNVSGTSRKSMSSLEEDEADQVPFSKEEMERMRFDSLQERRPSEMQRPQAGRFPSNVDATGYGRRESNESAEHVPETMTGVLPVHIPSEGLGFPDSTYNGQHERGFDSAHAQQSYPQPTSAEPGAATRVGASAASGAPAPHPTDLHPAYRNNPEYAPLQDPQPREGGGFVNHPVFTERFSSTTIGTLPSSFDNHASGKPTEVANLMTAVPPNLGNTAYHQDQSLHDEPATNYSSQNADINTARPTRPLPEDVAVSSHPPNATNPGILQKQSHQKQSLPEDVYTTSSVPKASSLQGANVHAVDMAGFNNGSQAPYKTAEREVVPDQAQGQQRPSDVKRLYTDDSIRNLHVPGEFPAGNY